MGMYAIVVRVWGNKKTKYYNDYRTGETLLFKQKTEAEVFKKKLIKESSPNAFFEVIPYKFENQKEGLMDKRFINRIGSKIIRE